jgi:hypothetical protein
MNSIYTCEIQRINTNHMYHQNKTEVKMEKACNLYRISHGWIIVAQTKDEDWIWHEHNEYDFIRENEKLQLLDSIKKTLNNSNQFRNTNRNGQNQPYIFDLNFKTENNFNKLANLYRLTLKGDTLEIVHHKLFSVVNPSMGFTPVKSEVLKFEINQHEDFEKVIIGLGGVGDEISS